MGWDIDRFPEGEVNLELICCICTCILEDPVESPCRHVFCSQCIKTWLSNQKSCPHCRAPVHKRDLQSVVPLLKNIISKQKIFCDNKCRGCPDVIALENLQGHIASCPYGLVACTYDGCNIRVMRKDHKAHIEVCAKRTVMCENGCEMFLTLGEQTSHNCVQSLRCHFQGEYIFLIFIFFLFSSFNQLDIQIRFENCCVSSFSAHMQVKICFTKVGI